MGRAPDGPLRRPRARALSQWITEPVDKNRRYNRHWRWHDANVDSDDFRLPGLRVHVTVTVTVTGPRLQPGRRGRGRGRVTCSESESEPCGAAGQQLGPEPPTELRVRVAGGSESLASESVWPGPPARSPTPRELSGRISTACRTSSPHSTPWRSPSRRRDRRLD
jgi:hypothetical protein